MPRMLKDLTPAEIRAKAAEMAPRLRLRPDHGEPGHFTLNSYVLSDIAKALDSGRTSEFLTAGSHRDDDRLFAGRVQRALEKLAGDGVLVKVPGGSGTLPDGTSKTVTWAHYYTPDAFKAAQARGERAHAERIAAARRWADIVIRLAKAGIEMDGGHRLSQDSWERLLDLAAL